MGDEANLWSVTDLVMRGSHAPLASTRAFLAEQADLAGAVSVSSLAFDERHFFRNLILGAPGLPNELQVQTIRDTPPTYLGDMFGDVFGRENPAVRLCSRTERRTQLHLAGSWVESRHPYWSGVMLEMGEKAEPTPDFLDGIALEVQLRLAASSHIAVRSDLILARQIDGSRTPRSAEGLAPDLTGRDLGRIMDIVRSTMDCEAVALYRRSESDALRLESSSIDLANVVLSDEIGARDEWNVARIALEAQRTTFFDSAEPSQYLGMKLRTLSGVVESLRAQATWYEVAVPIPASPSGGSGQAVGVVVAVVGGARGVDSHLLASLRNLAVRITAMSSVRVISTLGRHLWKADDVDWDDPQHSSHWEHVEQHEFAPVEKKIDHGMRVLHTGTGADLTALWVLDRADKHRRYQLRPLSIRSRPSVLERLGHYVDASGQLPVVPLPPAVIRGTDAQPAPLLWSLRAGRPCWLHDVFRDQGAIAGLSTQTVTGSEIVEPIFLDGRLVALLHLRSRRRENFRYSTALIEACSRSISILLRDARNRLSVQASTFEALEENRHDALNHLERALELIRDDAGRDAVSAAVREAWGCLAEGGEAEPIPDRAVEGVTSVIDRVAASLELDQELKADSGSRSLLSNVNVSGAALSAFEVILSNALTNARRHTSDGRLFYDAELNEVGGERFVDLTVRHFEDGPVPADVLSGLYRSPLGGRRSALSRSHYGSFLAGLRLRRAGGEAYIRCQERRSRTGERDPDGLWEVVVVLSIPISRS